MSIQPHQAICQRMEISLKPINYTSSNTDVCTLSRLLLEGVRVLALQSSNSPCRRKHHLEQEMIQGQATKEKRVGGKKAGGNLLKEEFCHVLASCFFFLLKCRFVSVLELGGGSVCE